MNTFNTITKLNNEELDYIKSMHTAQLEQKCMAICPTFNYACIVWNTKAIEG